MEKAVDTLIHVFTAFLFYQKYALLFSEGSEQGVSDEFSVAQFWNPLVKKQCDSATKKVSSFAVIL